MVNPYFTEVVLKKGAVRELACWLSVSRLSHYSGRLVINRKSLSDLSALMGLSVKTVQTYIKRLLADGWATYDVRTDALYLKNMRYVISKVTGQAVDNRSEYIRHKVLLPDSDEGFTAMLRNFKAFLFSVAAAGAVKNRQTILTRSAKKRKSRAIPILKASKTAGFCVKTVKGCPVAGVEEFAPDSLGVRFFGKRCGKHHSTITRYKQRAKKAGWLDYDHNKHVLAEIEGNTISPELAVAVAELSVLPGFGVGRTRLEHADGKLKVSVLLTDTLRPLVAIKRTHGCFFIP